RIDPTLDAGPPIAPFDGGTIGDGGIRLVQRTAATTSASPLGFPLPHSTTPGDTLIVCTLTGATGCSVQDNQGNVYRVAAGPQQGAGTQASTYLTTWYATAVDAGADPIEIGVQCGNVAAGAFAFEYAGLADLDVGV